jgi:hypothetical protein
LPFVYAPQPLQLPQLLFQKGVCWKNLNGEDDGGCCGAHGHDSRSHGRDHSHSHARDGALISSSTGVEGLGISRIGDDGGARRLVNWEE